MKKTSNLRNYEAFFRGGGLGFFLFCFGLVFCRVLWGFLVFLVFFFSAIGIKKRGEEKNGQGVIKKYRDQQKIERVYIHVYNGNLRF